MNQKKERIAVVILAKNEEAVIERALTSAAWADELIVVDDFSADRTPQIARDCGAKMFQRQLDDFTSQREFGAAQAEAKWIFSLDADEEVTAKLAGEIQQAAASGRYSAYQVPFKQYFFGRWLKYGGWYPACRIRLYDRTKVHWGKKIHEKISLAGPVGRLQNAVIHHSHQTIRDFILMLNDYTDREAASRFARGLKTSLFKVAGLPVRTFFAHYFLLQGFRDGAHGLVAAALMAFYKFSWQAKLWELSWREKNKEKIGRGPDW